MVGYTAGQKLHPTYQDVCDGDSGHTEAVQMLFNPDLVWENVVKNNFFKFFLLGDLPGIADCAF